MKKYLPFLGIAVMAISWTGVMPAQEKGSPKNGFTDPTRLISVSPGESFTILLRSNRAAGYAWQLARPPDEKVVKFLRSEYLPSPSEIDGADGKEVWSFAAVAAGQTTIALRYVHPWEKNPTPLREASFTVAVR